MKQTSSQNLPQRLRESTFREYEQIIKLAVDNHPKAITLKPRGSTLTFIDRLRASKQSLRQYRWITSIDMTKFELVFDDLIVSHNADANTVSFGPKVSVSEQISVDDILMPMSDEDTLTQLLEITELEMHTICMLAAKRLLRVPLQVKIVNSNHAGMYWENSYDVLVDENGNHMYTIR